MKKIFIAAGIAILLVSGSANMAYGWGVWGHNHINKGAVLALPREMGMFFYNHSDFIIEESTVPDLRKYTLGDKSEKPRHYINLEKYGYPREAVPATLEAAIAKYGKEEVMQYGILPWYIQEMMEKLTKAMRNKRKTEILFLAADLGHYIGDAHMPLHTTVEHDGQSTGQQGIHSFWEGQLPEIFGRDYKLYCRAGYIENIGRTTWNLMDSSYSLVDRLLQPEHRMRTDNPKDKQYVMGTDGEPVKSKFGSAVHNYEYSHVYHELLNGMVEQQMRKAIQLTASLWYTAWVNAGKPDLSTLDNESTTQRNMAEYEADMKAWKTGKVRGCKSDKEFPDVRPQRH